MNHLDGWDRQLEMAHVSEQMKAGVSRDGGVELCQSGG